MKQIRFRLAALLVVSLLTGYLAGPPEWHHVQHNKAARNAGQLVDSGIPQRIPKVPGHLSPPTPATARAVSTPSETGETNIFAAFSQWAEVYAGTPLDRRANLVPNGVSLARQRAEALAPLIQTNPAAALDAALSYSLRKNLPGEIAAWVEQPVNAVADYEVVASTLWDENGSTPPSIRRGLRVNGQLYEAFTFGEALAWPSQTGQPVNGFVLPSSATPTATSAPYPTGKSVGLAVVSPSPVRVLDSVESADYLKKLESEPICGESGLPVTALGSATVTQSGGTYTAYCCPQHATSLHQAAISDGPSGQSTATTTTDLPTTATGTGIANVGWTKGNAKRYIFCRPVFTDYQGYTSDSAVFAAYNGYSNYVVHTSFGQLIPEAIGTNLAQGSYVTPPLQLPGTVADYQPGGKDITPDIIAAAHAAGINFRNYQFFAIVNADKPGFNAAGVATIGPSMGTDGGSQSWCRLMGSQTALDPSLLGHELGHNVYLLHSHGWNTSGRSIIGPGAHDEYGDPDSLMGETWGRDSYVANLRYYLGWIPASGLKTLTGSGNVFTTPLSVLDDNTNGFRAIRVKHPRYAQYYWLEYRQGRSWMDANEAANSIGLRWGSPNGSETWWLNVAPARLGANRLSVGHTFSDPWGDLHITPVGPSVTTSNALDVTVAIGPFPGNHPPTADLASDRTTAPVGGSITFTSTVTDPENDPIAYGWDFGGTGADGPGLQNTNVVTHTFATAGTYEVRCDVSDMKGGLTSKTLIVQIGTPSGLTISGKVVAKDGTPLQGIEVQIDSTHFDFTDSQGNYSIGGLAVGSYEITVSDPILGASTFEAWIPNPVAIQKNLSGVNFTALAPTDSTGLRVEYYSDAKLHQLQGVNITPGIQFSATNSPGVEAVRWTGLFTAPLSGTYLFHALGDGAVQLTVNGQLFAGTMNSSTGEEVTAYATLSTAQPCAVQVNLVATNSAAHLTLKWTTPAGGIDAFTPDSIFPISGGLRGAYFADTSLTNLAFTRIDPTVDFPIGVSPGFRLPVDHYSVRWTGKVHASQNGRYEFHTVSDDGVRLWVNGKALINNWTDHGPTEDIGAIYLRANQDYDVLLEYYQGGGGAEIQLRWLPPGGTLQTIPASALMPGYTGLWAEYYNSTTLDGSPVVTQLDPVVDLEPVADAPTAGVTAGSYTTRWQGLLQAPTNGTYHFDVWVDDAMRFWVNGQKVFDTWGKTGPSELTADLDLLTNSPIPIRFELQQTAGNSGARLAWSSVGATSTVPIASTQFFPVRPGLWAEYFNGTELAGTPVYAYLESNINETYSPASPPNGVTTNAFSVRWHGRLSASLTGTHSLIATCFGGTRLYLDGARIINNWTPHTKIDSTVTLPLTGGQEHDFVVEYRSMDDGSGSLQLSWVQPKVARQLIPSVNLLPPLPTLPPYAAGLQRLNDHWQVSWDADLGPLSLLTAPDVRVPFTNWNIYYVDAYLSNGFWRADLPFTTNSHSFLRLNPPGQ